MAFTENSDANHHFNLPIIVPFQSDMAKFHQGIQLSQADMYENAQSAEMPV